jgi:hypothetical protein
LSTLKLISLAACIALAGCERKPVPLEKVMPPPLVKPSKPKDLVLSPQAIGPVAFGTPLSEVEIKFGQAMRLDEADNPECSFVSFKALPKVQFMVEKGVITRADVEKEIANTSGIGVGDTEEQLKQKYADAKVQPNAPGGHLFILPGDGKTALVLVSDGAKIVQVRAGLQPAVSNAKPCAQDL